jgi:hypothetical protein
LLQGKTSLLAHRGYTHHQETAYGGAFGLVCSLTLFP